MTKYNSYYGEMKDPYLLHEVKNGQIISYKRKGFFIPRTVEERSFTISKHSTMSNVYVDEKNKGYFKIETNGEFERFYIYRGASEFIAQVEYQIKYGSS